MLTIHILSTNCAKSLCKNYILSPHPQPPPKRNYRGWKHLWFSLYIKILNHIKFTILCFGRELMTFCGFEKPIPFGLLQSIFALLSGVNTFWRKTGWCRSTTSQSLVLEAQVGHKSPDERSWGTVSTSMWHFTTFSSSPFKATTASRKRCPCLSHLRIKAKGQRAGYLKATAGEHKTHCPHPVGKRGNSFF